MSSAFSRIKLNRALLAFGYHHSLHVKRFTVFFHRSNIPVDAENFYSLELSQSQFCRSYNFNDFDDMSSLEYRLKFMRVISSSDEAFETYVLSGSEFCLPYICSYMTIDEVLLEGLYGKTESLKRNELVY